MMKISLFACISLLSISLGQSATLIAHYELGGATGNGLSNSVAVADGGIAGDLSMSNVAVNSISGSTESPGSDYSLELTTRSGSYSGLYHGGFSSVGANWGIQFDLKPKTASGNLQTVLKIGGDGFQSPTQGLQLIYGNGASDQGSGLGFCFANSGGYGNRMMSTVNLMADEWIKVSIICLNGDLRLFLGVTDITDTLTKQAGTGLAGADYNMDLLKLGYNNSLGDLGVKNGTAYDEFKVWKAGSSDTLTSMMQSMNLIPEPTSASLGLLSLAFLLGRRKRV